MIPDSPCLVRLLGSPMLLGPGGPMPGFRYRKGWAVLARLALQPDGAHPRASLAALLWPRLTEAAALTNLRQVLADVGRALRAVGAGELLQGDRHGVWLGAGAADWVDLRRLRGWCAGRPAGAAVASGQEAVVAALGTPDRWLAPLLDGVAAGARDGGMDWLDEARRRWADEARDAVLALARGRHAAGRLSAALDAARTAWQHDTLHEPAAALLIELLLTQGDRRGAQEVFTLTDNHWRADLGTPAPATLRHGIDAPGAPAVAGPAIAPSPARMAAPAPPERRWLTVLHLQLRWPPGGPAADDAEALLLDAMSEARTRIAAWGGLPVSLLGDRADFCFGLGDDPEHAPERAVLAALAVQAGLRAPLRAALACVSGRTLVACSTQGVTLPLWLPQAAHAVCRQVPDATVWLCAHVAAAVAPRIGLAPAAGAPTVLPHGVAGPLACALPGWARPAGLSSPPPLRGRDAELQQLRQHWAQAVQGRPRWVAVVGAAGMGKTLLVRGLADELRATGVRVQVASCSLAGQQRPLGPLRPLIGQSEELLAHRARALDAAFAWLDGLSGPAPMLLVLEDMHWADEATREFVARYAAAWQRQRLLLVCTTRPEQPLRAEGEPPHRLTLGQLPAGPTEQLIQDCLLTQGSLSAWSQAQVQQMARRSGGVPLFAQRLALRAGSEAGPLARHEDGGLAPALQAELDRLGHDRRVLQAAAVLGATFDAGELQRLLPGQDVQAVLRRAQVLQLVRPLGSPVDSGAEAASFAFAHALIHEAALAGLPAAERRQWHLARLDRLLAQDGSAPDELALHHEGALQWGEAAHCWAEAGQQALRQEFGLDAMRHLARGLAAWQRHAGGDAAGTMAGAVRRMRLHHAQAAMMAEGYGSAAAYAGFAELLADAPAPRESGAEADDLHFRALAGLYMGAGSQGESHGLATAQRLAAQARTPPQRLMAEFALGNSLLWRGHLRQALHHQAQAAALSRHAPPDERCLFGADDPALLSQALQAWTLWFLGRPAQAAALARQAVAAAREAGRSHTLCFCLTLASAVHWCREDVQAVRRDAAEARALASRFHFPLWHGVNGLFLLWAQATAGDDGEAVRQQGQRAAQQMRAAYRSGAATAGWILGSAVLAAGQPATAEPVLAAALDDARRDGDRYCEPELLRLWARCRAAAGDDVASRQALRQAIAVAGEIGSPVLRARARQDAQALHERWPSYECVTRTA